MKAQPKKFHEHDRLCKTGKGKIFLRGFTKLIYGLDISNREKRRHPRFLIRRASRRASGFEAHFALRFALEASVFAPVLDEHFELPFKSWGNF